MALGFYSLFFTVFFAPVLLRGRLLAPNDAIWLWLGPFHAPRRLWNPDIFSGFPAFADPPMQAGYPLAWLFSALGAWNAFIISAYVVAATVTYGYIRAVTGSAVGALAAGLIYSMSAFMTAHLDHACIIHSVAWTPLILWSVERVRQDGTRVWIAVGSVAVALCALGGHPQFLAQAVVLASLYIVVRGWSAPRGALRLYGSGVAMLLGGAGVAAYLLVPAVELAQLSRRATLGVEEFTGFALPPGELLQLLFPFLFGSSPPGAYAGRYFGTWGLTETAGYVGLLSVMAALIGGAIGRSRSIALFWASAAVISVAMAVLPATSVAPLLYRIPFYGLFRAHGRTLAVTALAIASLAGMGIAALEQSGARARRVASLAACGVLAVIGAAAVAVWWLPGGLGLQEMAAARGFGAVRVRPWENPAVGVPVLIAALSAAALVSFSRVPRRPWQTLVLLACLIVDLGSCAWFLEWHYRSASRDLLVRPRALQRYADEAAQSRSRVYLQGLTREIRSAPNPNLNQLWGIPSANGYTSLRLGRYEHLLSLPWLDPAVLRADSQVLDLLSVRYLFVGQRKRRGFVWGPSDNLTLGQELRGVEWWTPGTRATHVAIAGALARSPDLADHTPVAELRVVSAAGDTVRRVLRAGDDFSEWAYDARAVRPLVRHRRASIFQSFTVTNATTGAFPGHSYLAVVDLGDALDVERIELEWIGPLGELQLRSLSTRDATSGTSAAVPAQLADRSRWQWVENIGSVTVYRNLRQLPRAWTVAQLRTLTADQIRAAITSSRLPDGEPFDLRTTALVEEEPLDWAGGSGRPGSADVVRVDENRVEVSTRTDAPAFLVLSDVDYPGWRASIDDQPVRLYRTNYVLRGVVLPPGQHRVEFVFRPAILLIGLAISALSACALLVFVAAPRWRGSDRAHP